MQVKEEEMRAGGREAYPIKIIETAGRTLEQTIFKFSGFRILNPQDLGIVLVNHQKALLLTLY